MTLISRDQLFGGQRGVHATQVLTEELSSNHQHLRYHEHERYLSCDFVTF